MTTTRSIIQAAYDKEAIYVSAALAARDWLADHEGKKLTARNKPTLLARVAEAIGAGPDTIRIGTSFGDLVVETWSYSRSGGREGWSVRIGDGACPEVDLAYFEQRNAPIFGEKGAIRKRQPEREALPSQRQARAHRPGDRRLPPGQEGARGPGR